MIPEDIDRAAWHRITFSKDDGGGGYWGDVAPIPDDDLNGSVLVERFTDERRVSRAKRDWRDRPGSYTGGRGPYPLLIRTDGVIDQTAELFEVTPHARAWSWRAIGVAVVGDFRNHKPTEAQWNTSVRLAALLIAWGTNQSGHTELPGASSDPSKECPGKLFPMGLLREQAQAHPLAALLPWEAEQLLLASGILF